MRIEIKNANLAPSQADELAKWFSERHKTDFVAFFEQGGDLLVLDDS